MRNATHIQIAFFTQYPAFDDSRAPDFKRLLEIASRPEFEIFDLFDTDLHVHDSADKADGDAITDPKLNVLLDFQVETHKNAVHIKEYCLEAESFYRSLHEMGPREFEKIYSDALAINNARQVEQGRLADENEPFSYTSATADLLKWFKRPLWTVEQATAISLNKDPGIVTLHSLKHIKRFSPFLEQYSQIFDMIQLAVRAKIFESEVSPATFMNWALVSLEPLVPEVRAAFLDFQSDSTAFGRKMNSHERRVENNLLEMFGVVFCARFGCNPFANPVPKVTSSMITSVLNDFSTLKVRPLGEDAIKLRLQEALSQIRARNHTRVKSHGPVDEA